MPGLIIQISDNEGHYNFELVEFQEFNEAIPFHFSSEENWEVEKEKFLEVLARHNKDPMAALEQHGITFGAPGQREQLRKQLIEEFKKRNNPIELK